MQSNQCTLVYIRIRVLTSFVTLPMSTLIVTVVVFVVTVLKMTKQTQLLRLLLLLRLQETLQFAITTF